MSQNKLKICFLLMIFFISGTIIAQLKPEFKLTKKPVTEYILKSINAESYKFIIMLGAGISIPAGNMEKYSGGFTANISFSPYSNGSLGLRFNANLLSMKYNDFYKNKSYGGSSTISFTADVLTIYSLNIEMLFGNLKSSSKFNLYGFSGIELESRSGGNIHEMLLHANDTIDAVYQKDENGAVRFNFGSGINYKLTNNFRLFAELQYDMSAVEIFSFSPKTSAFLLRSGIFINF